MPALLDVWTMSTKRKGLISALLKDIETGDEAATAVAIARVFAALSTGSLPSQKAMVIQMATIVTFVISTYWTVLRYATPISPSAALHRD